MPHDQKLPPPSGDSQRAESYVSQLISLISEDKLKVTHTDLSKYDPSSLQDHYSLDLHDYQVEISHSKQPSTGNDSYVILFNNIKNLAEGETQKEILAYLVINEEQFKKLKDVADEQIETLKKIEEEKRFKAAMTPVDQLIDKITKGEVDLEKHAQPIPEIPAEEKTEENTKQEEKKTEKETQEEPPIPLDTVTAVPPGLEERPIKDDETPPIEQSNETKVTQHPTEPVSALAAAAAIPIVEETKDENETAAAVPLTSSAPDPIHLPKEETTPTPESPNQAEPPTEIQPEPPIQTQTPPEPTPTSVSDATSMSTSAPSPAPTMSIEQVQKALQEAYAKSPQTPMPAEFRSAIESAPTEQTPTPSFVTPTINTMPTNPQPANQPIDQAIDDAFKPSQNAVLTPGAKTPEV